MMRTKQKPNPALPQPQYYGNAKAAKEDYCDMVKSRHPEVDDPLSIPVDEESLVLSGHGRPHGRFPWLNKAVKPTHSTSYTRLKHTLTADSPQPRPRPARPPAYDVSFLIFILFPVFLPTWLSVYEIHCFRNCSPTSRRPSKPAMKRISRPLPGGIGRIRPI
nr:uncharacterized protein LOC127346982 [Lolium perenne]